MPPSMPQPGSPGVVFDDPCAFAALVARLEPQLRVLIRRYERDPEAAADLLQETWCRAWERRAQCAKAVDGWFVVLCHRLCQNHVRREITRRTTRLTDALAATLPSQTGDIAATGWLTHALDASEADDVWDAIVALPPRQLVIVVDRLLRGQSTAATAERLGLARGTVAATLSQARAKLRERLWKLRASTS